MIDLETLTGSRYLSFSSLETWLSCGEKYRLTKVIGVARGSAWYLLGGSAVHEATELLDKGEKDNVQDAWNAAWQTQLDALSIPESEVKAGGRKTKDMPYGEDRTWWELNGPGMVSRWQSFADRLRLDGWEMLAVEAPFEIEIGDAAIRGYVDRVLVDPNGVTRIVDLKTGKQPPKSNLQLGVYRLGIQQALGIDAEYGHYYMAREGTFTPTAPLTVYTEDLIGTWFAKAKQAIEAEVFIPHVQMFCSSCEVSKYCVAYKGAEAEPLPTDLKAS